VGRLNGHRVQLTGVIAEEPDLRDTGANYVVAVTADVVGGQTRPLSGKVQIHTSRAVALEYGDAVEVTGRLAAPRNDALLAYRSILARRGIASTMRFPRILDLGNRSSGPAEWIVLLRQRLEGGIDAWLPQPEAALLIAIALGSRSAALGNVVHPLISTGLIHIIAVSGIKVAMVAGTGYELLRRLPGRGLRLASGLTLLAAYVLLTGDTVSGERSAVMWGLVFLAAYLGRGTVALLSLTLVAALMVALQPDVVWDPAFQMTALGTGSIVAFSDRLTQALRAIPSPFRESFCVTLAAQAGTLPVVALSFHVVSIWGPVANALVLPLLPLLIALGFALGALSEVVPLAALVAALSYALLHTALTVASALAQLPGAIPVTTVASPFTAVYYVALAWLSVWALRRAQWAPPGRRPATLHDLTFGVAVGAVVLTGTLLPSSIHATQLHWLGTGEALLLQSRGRTVLIDGSPRPFELLEALGSELGLGRTIDAIIVTDPRANVTGLLDVLSHYTVGEVLDVGCEYPTRTYARWRAALRSRRIPVYALRTGVHLSAGNAQIAAIAPDGVYPQPRDSIGLLRLTVPGKRVLLAGAASERELTEAVFRPVSLGADLLVVDAGTPIPAAFLRHVAPARVVRLAIKSRAAMTISPDLARD
jgi:competence protein ComEC